MFEARLVQGSILKKVLDALKELITDARWECTSTGMTLQAMDSSHASLCGLLLREDAFEKYRCDRQITLGMNLGVMSKIMRCASNDDIITMQSEDDPDTLTFKFESKEGERDSEYEVKLSDIDGEHLGIPDQDYSVTIKMPSHELARICRDLSQLGDTLEIAVTKNGVQFRTEGDAGQGKVNLKQVTNADKEEDNISIDMEEPVSLTFASRYMCFFTKATPLSPTVQLQMTKDSPLVVEYKIGDSGHLRFFLAPKIEEDEN
ncbi:LOW QUALITY PROTEIN: proliferating cell nuclear antigen-like [Amphiura filiformis]|uniref:LOW QUALITY PROTEIN: proliferating cell nuclear antigen-like n=1 Tax=Amphiura filiformis TaxID=82378 RepID=UPI003B228209